MCSRDIDSMSRIFASALGLTGDGQRPMRYMIRDWMRWSRGERMSAIAILAASAAAYGFLLMEAVAG
jgi:hypothetical protein